MQARRYSFSLLASTSSTMRRFYSHIVYHIVYHIVLSPTHLHVIAPLFFALLQLLLKARLSSQCTTVAPRSAFGSFSYHFPRRDFGSCGLDWSEFDAKFQEVPFPELLPSEVVLGTSGTALYQLPCYGAW